MPTYKSTHIGVYNKKRCEIYTILFKNFPHQFFHNTIDLHFCYSNCANMCGYCSFVSKYFMNSSFHLSHINAASTTTHHQPAPTITTTHNPLQNLILTKLDLSINQKTQIIKSNGSSNPSTQT